MPVSMVTVMWMMMMGMSSVGVVIIGRGFVVISRVWPVAIVMWSVVMQRRSVWPVVLRVWSILWAWSLWVWPMLWAWSNLLHMQVPEPWPPTPRVLLLLHGMKGSPMELAGHRVLWGRLPDWPVIRSPFAVTYSVRFVPQSMLIGALPWEFTGIRRHSTRSFCRH